MKCSELPYRRYTVEEGREAFAGAETLMKNAKSADDVLAARKIMEDLFTEYSTAASLAGNRFNLNMRDEFYMKEVEYYDEVSPLFSDIAVKFNKMLLETPFRAELEKKINPRILRQAELSLKAFSPETIEECRTENATVTEYAKLMSGMTFDWEGKKLRYRKQVRKMNTLCYHS